MTIQTTSNKAQWQGNGATTVFSFNFLIASASQAMLYYEDASGNITIIPSSSYTISGLGSANGGTVTYPLSGSPIASGTSLTLVRSVTLQQLIDLINQDNYYPDSVEQGMDYLMQAIQQIAEVESRAIVAPETDTAGLDMTLPSATVRASALLGFDANGKPVASAAQSGTAGPTYVQLAASTGASLVGGGVQYVASLTALRALLKGSASASAYVSGIGDYYLDPSDATSPDNGGTVIVANDGGRWKFRGALVALSTFGVTGSGDETTLVQFAFDFAVATSQNLIIDRHVTASQVVVNGANGLAIHSTGSITGLASGTYDAVLTIKNSVDVYVTGRLPVSAAYNSGYQCAVAIYTDNGTQAAKMGLNIITSGAQRGFRIGRSTEANALISEIVINGGYSNGCPIFIEAWGTQTVIDVRGYQAISDLGANPAGWSSLNRIVCHAVGANVRFNGGEFLLTDVTTGEAIIIEPIADSTNGNQYGSVSLNGVEIESASQWVLIQNPNAIGSLIAGRGGISFTGCKGVHTQDSFTMINVSDASFPGTIKVDESCKFFSTVARANSNIACSGTACDIYVADGAFGTNFVQGLSGTTGGIVHFDRRKILEFINTNAQSFSSGVATVVKYSAAVTNENTARFTADYSASTGEFTVPAGGLKDVVINMTQYFSTLTNNPIVYELFKNGTKILTAPTRYSSQWFGANFDVGDLAAGDVIAIKATQGSGSTATSGDASEQFVIYARN